MHASIETGQATLDDLCIPASAACATYSPAPICGCLAVSVLKMWNYDLATLQADDDVLGTLNGYGSREDLESVLGNPAFDGAGDLVSALSMAHFLQDRSKVEGGSTVVPVNEAWEEQVFLETVQDGAPSLDAYLPTRSFPNKDPSVRPSGAPSPGPSTSAPTTPASPRCGE
jgi:hypothetical protein